MKIEDGFLKPYIEDHGFQSRSQDLPLAYSINSCFYLISLAEVRSLRSFSIHQTIPLLIESPEEALDIDTDWDWRIAQSVLLERTAEHQLD
jgi:CMP-N,N'-diacetyllegionaminic acid synthase